jgi:hypothetical protein
MFDNILDNARLSLDIPILPSECESLVCSSKFEFKLMEDNDKILINSWTSENIVEYIDLTLDILSVPTCSEPLTRCLSILGYPDKVT